MLIESSSPVRCLQTPHQNTESVTKYHLGPEGPLEGPENTTRHELRWPQRTLLPPAVPQHHSRVGNAAKRSCQILRSTEYITRREVGVLAQTTQPTTNQQTATALRQIIRYCKTSVQCQFCDHFVRGFVPAFFFRDSSSSSVCDIIDNGSNFSARNIKVVL